MSEALVTEYHIARCVGGYNVHGLDANGRLVYECLHLHKTASEARACLRHTLAALPAPSAGDTSKETP